MIRASMPPDHAPGPASRILAVATEHLRRLGPDRLTVVGVATELGMTHANVYRYFASKAALMEAVTTAWLRDVDDALVATADAPDPADGKLERMVLEIARRYRDKAENDPKLFDIFATAYDQDSLLARKHRARLRALVERVVEEGLAAGLIGKDRGRAASLVFDTAFRFIHPSAVRFDRTMPRPEMQARLERVMRAMLVALRAR